jgi:hypothetical protein
MQERVCKNTISRSGALRVASQIFEFDNSIDKITDWQKIHSKEVVKRGQGLKVNGKY